MDADRLAVRAKDDLDVRRCGQSIGEQDRRGFREVQIAHVSFAIPGAY